MRTIEYNTQLYFFARILFFPLFLFFTFVLSPSLVPPHVSYNLWITGLLGGKGFGFWYRSRISVTLLIIPRGFGYGTIEKCGIHYVARVKYSFQLIKKHCKFRFKRWNLTFHLLFVSKVFNMILVRVFPNQIIVLDNTIIFCFKRVCMHVPFLACHKVDV